MSQTERPTPQDYRDLFEINKLGARVFDDLIARFYRPRGNGSGIDRVLDAHEFMGRRQVLDFITNQIDSANGVHDDQNQGD